MSFSLPIAADIPLYADKLLLEIDWLTNSIFVSLIVVGIVFFFARRAYHSPHAPGRRRAGL